MRAVFADASVVCAQAEFARRSVIYASCDARLFAHTRFFAAAALVNAVLAQLSNVGSAVGATQSLKFLSEVGTALELDNLAYARAISGRAPAGSFDHALVNAEQGRIQRYVRAHKTQRPQEWESIRSELNNLLNARHAGSFLSWWCESSGRLSRVLRDVREEVRWGLDFENEAHRVLIGLGLINQIRSEGRKGVKP